MKIVTVIGARPQFIKAAAVSRVIQNATGIREVIVHTGQHFDHNMSDIFFEEMQIPKPDYHLEVHSLSHGAMTGRMMEEVEKVLLTEKPDYTLVYGDTNSTLAGALASKKLHIPVIHVEAGLRSFNMNMPEEINRILTDRISDLLFCPTETAVKNLEREGFSNFPCEIIQNGDVMEDAALFYSNLNGVTPKTLETLNLETESYALCTLHRAENTDDPARLGSIVEALNELAGQFEIVLPLHPRTKKVLENAGLRLNAKVIPPVGYLDMIQLVKNARLVLTDSGGLQKEAYFFNKYCLTLRDQTEWTELVEGGYNRIVGTDRQRIMEAVAYFSGKTFEKGESLYGGGTAARKIVQHLLGKA